MSVNILINMNLVDFVFLCFIEVFYCLYKVLFSLFAGVTDIHGRLLDHKPVIQSEIKYFLKEFEVYNDSKKTTDNHLLHIYC